VTSKVSTIVAKTHVRGRPERHVRLARSRALRLVPASGLVDDFVLAFDRDRNRSIQLLPHDLGPGSPSGMWIATERGDYVVFPADASSSERTAIICHEVAHMVLGHQAEAQLDRAAQLVEIVAPHVNPATAQRFLTRHGYAEAMEADAEELATALVAKLARNAEALALRCDAVSDRLR